ncbi:CX3C chemokine receptor 1 [Antechinus flavipes]|uniref:CX3C chemokine receptor 1 n=1 Tax=Antechinus flavipes TaxID=38775 RepID=UPI002235DF8A|nr:CX3C chemokine receptor 1 [Antechinus flavipes]
MTDTSLESTTPMYNYDDFPVACDHRDILNFGIIFLPTLYSLVFAFGLVGNLLVVLALTNSSKHKSITDIYLLNLALSDLLFVTTLPFWTHYVLNEQGFNNALCKLITAFYFIGYFGGIFFITVISIDRYVAIVLAANSLHSRTVQQGVVVSLSVWAAAILVATPHFMFTELVDHECLGNYPAMLREVWPVLQNVETNFLGFVAPFLIMCYCYFAIIQTIFSCKNHKKIRTIKLILVVVVVFFLFWTPYNVMVFLQTLNHYHFFASCDLKQHLRLAMNVTEAVALLHCCLNPFIYAFAGEKFRKYLYHLYRKCLSVLCNYDALSQMPAPDAHKRESTVISNSVTSFTSDGDGSILL